MSLPFIDFQCIGYIYASIKNGTTHHYNFYRFSYLFDVPDWIGKFLTIIVLYCYLMVSTWPLNVIRTETFTTSTGKMSIVKIFLCAFLFRLVNGLEVDLFLNSSNHVDIDFTCCFDRFTRIGEQSSVEQKSALILLPDANTNFRLEQTFVQNSPRINEWSLEFWDLNECSVTKQCTSSIATNNNFIFIENDESDHARDFEKFLSLVPKNKNRFLSSLLICIVKNARRKCRGNSTGLEPLDGGYCTLANVTNPSPADIARKSSAPHPLRVARFSSVPFAYYDKTKGHLKGIEVSLLKTVAGKLKMPMEVLEINGSETNKWNASAMTDFSVKKWDNRSMC